MPTTEHVFEVETDLSGTFSKGDDYAQGYVDDLEAGGLYALRWVKSDTRPGGFYRRTDLLEGLSLEARAIVEANILAFVGESDAVSALECAA